MLYKHFLFHLFELKLNSYIFGYLKYNALEAYIGHRWKACPFWIWNRGLCKKLGDKFVSALTGLCVWDYVDLRKSARCGEDDDTKWGFQLKCLKFSIRPDLRDYLTIYRIIIFSTVLRFNLVNLDRLNRLDSHGHTGGVQLMLLV